MAADTNKTARIADLSILAETIINKYPTKTTVNSQINATNQRVAALEDIDQQNNVIETVKVNGTALTVDGNKAVDVIVPQNTSDLTNDSDYQNGSQVSQSITTVTDPLAERVTTLEGSSVQTVKVNGEALALTDNAVDVTVPTKVSELTNDADYQNATQVQTTVDTAIAKSGHASYTKVDAVPSVDEAQENILYLVMNTTTNHYDIYAKIANDSGYEMVLLDDTTVDLTNYVTKEDGKALSSNDFTDNYKTKLDGIAAGAQVNTITGIKGSAETAYRTGNVSISPSDLGLGSVSNTPDSEKSVASATKATQDTLGQQIDSTYIKSISISGKTLTYTKGDGTTGTQTTQDTTYSAATTSAAGLMSADDKTKLDGITASADTVAFTRSLTSGTKVGTLTINGTGVDLYAPTDTNTTYSQGTGISISGTTINNSGVRSIATGSSNGTISVNTNGTTADVAVKGLGSAAYTASSAYLAASGTAAKATADASGNTITSTYLKLSGGTMTGNIGIPAGVSTIDGSVPYAGSNAMGSADITQLSSFKTMFGSYTDTSLTWYNIISTRHRNGNGDGTSYGMYFRSTLTSSGNLLWGKQYGSSNWQAERTILDSSNYTSYAPTKTGSGASGTWGISISGNAVAAASATKATQDSAGQQINTTYIKALSASGNTITYTKGSGTTGTITISGGDSSSEIKRLLNCGLDDGTKTISTDGTVIKTVDSSERTLTKTFTNNFGTCTSVLTDSSGTQLGKLVKTFSSDGATITSTLTVS